MHEVQIYYHQVKALTLLRQGFHLPKTPLPAWLLTLALVLFLQCVYHQRRKERQGGARDVADKMCFNAWKACISGGVCSVLRFKVWGEGFIEASEAYTTQPSKESHRHPTLKHETRLAQTCNTDIATHGISTLTA